MNNCKLYVVQLQECLAYQQFPVSWDKVHLQQYYQQMNPHYDTASQLSPLAVRGDTNQYQQVHPYQQQQIMSQSAIMENENNDIVLIKVCNLVYRCNNFTCVTK